MSNDSRQTMGQWFLIILLACNLAALREKAPEDRWAAFLQRAYGSRDSSGPLMMNGKSSVSFRKSSKGIRSGPNG